MNQKTAANPAVERTRRVLFWSVTSAIGLVFVLGILYALGVFDAGARSDADYARIPGTQPPAAGAHITVVEYFSYSCPHCREFDPQVEALRADLPEGVEFRRSPVIFGGIEQEALARAYLVLEASHALGDTHERIFQAIHDERRDLSTLQGIAEVVDGHGIARDRFLRLAHTTAIGARLEHLRGDQIAVGIQSIPTLVVAGHYRIEVAQVGRARAVAVARDLVQQISAGKAP